MATRGVFQLKQLKLYYCEFGGSSAAVRDYIGNGPLVAWATQHDTVDIKVLVNNGQHPFVEADYATNTTRHQICLKNKASWKEVDEIMNMLRNRSGRKISKITRPVVTDTPSIQGVWTPFLNLQNEPEFKVQIVSGQRESI